MQTYLFNGLVFPERAQLSIQFDVDFSHLSSGLEGKAMVRVINNQIAIWVNTEHEWDIFDLRNVVKGILQGHLAMASFLKGYAHDVDIIRVLNPVLGLDYVFGIEIGCIEARQKNIELHPAINELQRKKSGEHGILIDRCLSDLVSAMKNPDDTGFYCYRAIESLRHHCASLRGLSASEKSSQWQAFREMANCSEESLRKLKGFADPLRHGEVVGIDGPKRAEIFMATWDIVDGYLAKI